MNDYGLFNVIRKKLLKNKTFRDLTSEIYTQVPDDISPPYALIDFCDFIEDRPFKPSRVLLQVKIKIVTQYHGLKELHQIIEAIHKTLEHQALKIAETDSQRACKAQFRIKHFKADILPDGYSRVGEILYETRLSFKGSIR
ncbi:MAG: hypothetical protein IBJ00_02450 [Alphaproteobacteria bacterium]|nr:hypothetical protein [Alphaproteobacteria bacterium]